MEQPVTAKAVVFLCLMLWGVASQAKQTAVVVDKSSNVAEISSADLAKILTFDTTQWSDGRKVVVVLRDPASPEVQEALQSLLKMPQDKVKALLAAHKSSFFVAKSDEELLNFVAANSGAIGLINVYSINSKVSVVKVDRKLPLEPGYLLH
jgi:ABC-type phosphate transport system substrate-binding protein